MRKNSLFLLGTAAGICLTLLFTGPQTAQWVAVAKADFGANHSHPEARKPGTGEEQWLSSPKEGMEASGAAPTGFEPVSPP